MSGYTIWTLPGTFSTVYSRHRALADLESAWADGFSYRQFELTSNWGRVQVKKSPCNGGGASEWRNLAGCGQISEFESKSHPPQAGGYGAGVTVEGRRKARKASRQRRRRKFRNRTAGWKAEHGRRNAEVVGSGGGSGTWRSRSSGLCVLWIRHRR